MWNKTVLMNFSGIYPQEDCFKEQGTWLDMTDLKGVNCYCTEEAGEIIRQRIRKFRGEGIHFLDSGNYHYLSKFWLEKIQKAFALLVFDHHTDMQEAAFFGLLSCGSWVREVLDTNENLRDVCIAGPSLSAFAECQAEERGVTAVAEEELSQNGEEKLLDWLKSSQLPLYLSIDKDILAEEEARTNWDQGQVSLKQLLNWIKLAFAHRRILGVDVCGENPQDTALPPKEEDLKINRRTNAALWNCLQEALEMQKICEEESRKLDEKFLSSKQESLKLDIALKRYFEGGMKYASYLSLRIRPAGEQLIREGENRTLKRFLKAFPVDGAVLEDLLLKAEKYKNKEAQLLLLQKKREVQGFQEESWEL